MHLLDRDQELEALMSAARSAQAGTGRVAVISGEAGIGKSALVRAFLERLPEEMRIAKGACENLSVAEPLGPLRDVARDAGWVFSEDLSTDGPRLRHFSEALEAFGADLNGTVLVIEDLHWADEATLDFLRYVARRIDDRRILLIVTSRTDESAGRTQVRRAFGEAPAEAILRLTLGPLSKSSVEQLAASAAIDPGYLLQISGGNAFYITELLRGEHHEAVPESVQDAVLARADRLSDEGRTVLEIASVFPRRAEIELLSILCGDDPDLGIRECIGQGLMDAEAQHLTFRHELARQAVEANLSSDRRASLHARLFALLDASGEAVPARLLHHARAANMRDAVARLAPQAAREAERLGARREAAAHYQVAVEAAGDRADADLLEQAALSNYMIGDFIRAMLYQGDALARFQQTGPITSEGDAWRKLSRYRWGAMDLAGAREAAMTSVRTLANNRGAELAMAYSTVAQLDMLAFRYDDVAASAEPAIVLAREFDRPDIESHALNNLAMSKSRTDPTSAIADMDRSLEIALSLDHADHAARAYGNGIYLRMYSYDFRAAREWGARASEYQKKQQIDGFQLYSLGTQACVELALGDWEAADALLVRCNQIRTRYADDHIHLFSAAVAQSFLSLRRGEVLPDDVSGLLGRFLVPESELQRFGPCAEIAAEKAWINGEGLENAVAMLEEAVTRAPNDYTVPELHLWLHRLAPGRTKPDLTNFFDPHRLEIGGNIQAAAREWASRGMVYEQAMTLATGDIEAKKEALGIFEQLGAVAPASKVKADIFRSDPGVARSGPRAATRRNPAGLTHRQMEVLGLLDKGLSNAEIADRLFVSPKTVDHHVSAILAKLDAASRGEAASKARDMGMITSPAAQTGNS